ncbi:sirohydrochlorin cobaltochelatase [Candidatus Marinarcus aquaticus]|uniref:Cobalt chelatase n=1 Tax=Candidatus Marinarcus aquaticus TaxID=2044504 RepID=A0A4Q0XLR1_9BACT|nr:sirohydrochlorin cobaltochelatase [Candidatus Marinarcus aquaticus]RXJ54088.1 cobalt chelatase [Candidatus Marinarcus aquaticus]
MKRYRHYKKDKAIILSVFGSVVEQQKYLDLKQKVEAQFEGADVYLAVSSRMVLKVLLKKGFEYKSVAQTLADIDNIGYRNIIVSSINLYPTEEHELLKRTVEGFKLFSYANIRLSNAIFTKTKDTTHFLKELDETVSKPNQANLYIIHGSPKLELGGLEAISYTAQFLEHTRRLNYTCSLEGAFPFSVMKDSLVEKMQQDGVQKVQIVPMLLVSGNHYIKDMTQIKEELSEHFDTSIVKSITEDERFNLIEIPIISNIILNNIKEEVIKLGHGHE